MAVPLISSLGDRPLSLSLGSVFFFFFSWKWFEGKIDL